MRERLFLFFILVLSSALLVYETTILSISYDEAEVFFHGTMFIHYLVVASTKLLGQNDFALRLPFILLHLSSIVLVYKISKLFLKKRVDLVFAVGIYAFLPGVNSIALLVNNSILVVFLSLLFTYLYLKEYKVFSHIILVLALFVDNSFAIFYIALFVYALFKQKTDLLILTLVLFGASMYLYGFDTGGKPKGYFVDTLGVYAAIFSPFVFLYFIYSMYRILVKEEKNLLWYISFFSLVVSLLLSLRQRLTLEDFAPFVVLAIPLMVKVFFNSYRVRLPEFRKLHTVVFVFVLCTLFINTMASFFHKPLYLLMKEPSKHFAVKYHVAKELSEILKSKGIDKVILYDEKLALRLAFYNIQNGGSYKLSTKQEIEEGYEQIDISYYGKMVKTFYLYRVS
jgi:4-amino-4-deoxy-L-arabinose transferase-like glycosyltransferase